MKYAPPVHKFIFFTCIYIDINELHNLNLIFINTHPYLGRGHVQALAWGCQNILVKLVLKIINHILFNIL